MTLRIHHLPMFAGSAVLAIFLASCGGSTPSASTTNVGGEATAAGSKTVEIAMEDIKFDQTELTVKAGETIEFRFVNDGKIAHDAFIGDIEAQLEHGSEMAEMDDASEHSDEEPALVLQPDEVGELSYTFSEPGAYQVGCHQPGHYEAGMKIDVTVE